MALPTRDQLTGATVTRGGFKTAIGDMRDEVAGKAATTHTHTAASVGAAAATHTHTAANVGAAASNHTHTAADVGAAASNHTHTAADVGAAAANHGAHLTAIHGGISTDYVSVDVYGRVTGSNNCNCQCNCNCCFAPGTLVRMADGSTKRIEDVLEGDMLSSAGGPVRVEHCIHSRLGENTLWSLNDEVSLTGGHMLPMADGEWAVCDVRLYNYDRLLMVTGSGEITKTTVKVQQLNVGDMAGGKPITSIAYNNASKNMPVHNLVVSGMTFTLASGLEVGGFAVTAENDLAEVIAQKTKEWG